MIYYTKNRQSNRLNVNMIIFFLETTCCKWIKYTNRDWNDLILSQNTFWYYTCLQVAWGHKEKMKYYPLIVQRKGFLKMPRFRSEMLLTFTFQGCQRSIFPMLSLFLLKSLWGCDIHWEIYLNEWTWISRMSRCP